MAKIKSRSINFQESISPDVVGYKLYYEEDPTEVTYDSPSVDLDYTVSGGIVSADLNDNNITEAIDGIYNVGVVAVDDYGNESDMSKGSLPLDNQAPTAPGAITLV